MSAVDDLVELVERASAVERAALASKWKDRQDLEAMARSVQRSIDQQRDLERRSRPASGSTARWDRVRADLLAGDPEAVPVVPAADASPPQPIAAEAARAEADAQAAVTVAQLALQRAHLAVLRARIARLDAGDTDADVADGHNPLPGRNAVSRHGPALAKGLHGEIEYILTRKPRSVVKSLAISPARSSRASPSASLWACSTWASSAPSSGTPGNGCCPTSDSGRSRSSWVALCASTR